ncbi:hypothetical protein JCM11641_000193, partial [Rhodosporidiobolus odoratus]
AFFQTLVNEDDIPKTAIKTPWGLYEWVVMPQGLCNAPATHQRCMNEALTNQIGRTCHAFVDDILIWASSLEEHEKNVRKVLSALRDAGLYCSPKKTDLVTVDTEFLGHRISRAGIAADPNRIERVVNWPTPTTVKQLRGFLGLVQYLRNFIIGLAQHTAVLTPLTRKGTVDITALWTKKEDEAFQAIRRVVTSLPVLRPVDHSEGAEPLWVMTDASKVGVGAVLLQGPDWRTAYPCSYYSRQYIPAERNYPTHEQELLAVVVALKAWRIELLGESFSVLTDHETLKHSHTQPDLSKRQARWSEVLADYDYETIYVPGEKNTVADGLSRYPFQMDKSEAGLAVMGLSESSLSKGVLQTIREGYADDTECVKMFEAAGKSDLLREEDGLLYTEDNRLVVPQHARLRETLLHDSHDAVGHFGALKSYQALSRLLFWPGMSRDVKQYCRSCNSCQRMKAETKKAQVERSRLPLDRLGPIVGHFFNDSDQFSSTISSSLTPVSSPYASEAGVLDHTTSYSSSSSGFSSPTPVPRIHTRSAHRTPSFTLSDPLTFHTASRNLALSIPRSVRFANLNMSAPPPIPPRPLSSSTNPQHVWGGQSAPVNPQPTSVAGSVRSTGSSLRRARALEEAEQAEARRRAAFEANEARIKQELEDHLEQADEESLAQGGKAEPGIVPPPAGVDGEPVVLERQLQELSDRKATLERILLSRRFLTGTPVVDPLSSYEQLVSPSSDVVDIAFKKVSAPKAWTGEFNHRRREAWIKPALGYLSSIGISPSLKLVKAKQPGVFYHLRSLFSTEAKASSLSPQDWFDGVQRRSPFSTVQSIFDSMRLHWVEEGAADAVFSKYRKASQRTLKVRDFGALVEVLANDIFDRTISDGDKKATFLEGLNPSARNFVRQVQATQAASFGSEARLDFDVLETKSLSTTSTPAAAPSRRAAASSSTDTSSPKPSASKPSDTGSSKPWAELAASWQECFPISNKASWFKKDAKELSSVVKCYNCACLGHHPSSACPNLRQDPRTLVIASVTTRASSLPPSSPPPLPELSDVSEVEENSAPLAGKAHGEQGLRLLTRRPYHSCLHRSPLMK